MSNRVLTLRPPPPGDDVDDTWLVAACAIGDGAALARLYRRYHALVTRVATRMTPPGTEVDDLVQLTFLGAWKQASGFRREASVRGWLIAITANLAWKARRGERRRQRALELMEAEPREAPIPVEAAAERRDLVARVHAALNELPRSLQALYVMCDVEEVPLAEAAKALGLATTTAWRRLHAARRQLLALVEEDP